MKKTKTTKTKKFISVSIESDGRSDNTFAKLSNGTNLGLVQSINWTCNVGESARCQITTLLTKAQLSALMEDSVIRYRLVDEAESDKEREITCALHRINKHLELGAIGLNKFSHDLFEIARKYTYDSDRAVIAAQEFAKMGFSYDKVLSMTKDALILAGMSKLDIPASCKKIVESQKSS